MRPSMLIGALLVLIGATVSQSAVYELKRNNVTCLFVNSTIMVKVAYMNTKGKMASASWTLGKAANISGQCDWQTKQLRSELTLVASGARLSLQFGHASGIVSLANVSLTVDIRNGTMFVNPNITGLVTLTARPSLPLSSDLQHFVCRSAIQLPLAGGSAANGSSLQLSHTLLQAFGMKDGQLSSDANICPEDRAGSSTARAPTTTNPPDTTTEAGNATSITTHHVPPMTTTPSPSDAPLLNLTLRDGRTGRPCLLLSGRLQLRVAYNKTKGSGVAVVPVRQDASVGGDCGGPNGTSAAGAHEQTLVVSFFDSWRLALHLSMSGSSYGLTGVSLSYNVNNSAVFPNARDVGKALIARGNHTYIGGVPSNGYYACSLMNVSLDGAYVALTVHDVALQGFRNVNDTNEGFTGTRFQCSADSVDNVVPIVVGAALAGLVVIVLVAYLIGRRRQSAREGYQSV